MANILIVDDELSMREFLKILLEKEGYQAFTAEDGIKALKIAKTEQVDLLITDIRMPGMGGLELLDKIKEISSNIPAIMITAYASPDDAVNAMKSGAYDYITKPFKVDEIKSIIRNALASMPPQKNGKGTVSQVEGIIGKNPEMVKIFDLIKQIAPTQASVMINGESGTGKELVARAIHNYSRVAGNPFVPITCSAIPESLIESELFGHVKGSFTGAVSDKIGLFELANNGSVFLDEIGELTPMIQTKLLRILQEREFKMVGGTKTIKVNVRIIAATNKNLEEEVMAGRFREDLYYRLAVVPIRVPALRERKSDIPLLIKHFLDKYSKRFEKDVREMSSYVQQMLLDYDFPGNVRELENIVERGVALENSNIILPESLTLSMHRKNQASETNLISDSMQEEEVFDLGLEQIMAQTEKRLIRLALQKANFSKMKAAELLKISFRSIRYKVQKYKITY